MARAWPFSHQANTLGPAPEIALPRDKQVRELSTDGCKIERLSARHSAGAACQGKQSDELEADSGELQGVPIPLGI